MNLIEILNSNILLEAVRINNGKEAYELIKNNKLGVKLDPSYKSVNENIIPYLDKLINIVGQNNAVFAIQLAANKIPVNKLKKNIDLISEISKYRNRPWAKQNQEYKDIINFNSSNKFDPASWKNIILKLNKEKQIHGHGDIQDTKTLYDDGTWTLQTPTSFKGAKSISYYGKKGEKQTPTHWCTRSDIISYDEYTNNNSVPLYIIRNWDTGDAYQMSIRMVYGEKRIDFLNKNDERGDSISEGDLSTIPDELLKKIKAFDGKTILDYKKASQKIKIRNVKNPATILKNTEWGKEEKVKGSDAVKQKCLNFIDKETNRIQNYFVNNKIPSKNNLGNLFRYKIPNTKLYYMLGSKYSGHWYLIDNNNYDYISNDEYKASEFLNIPIEKIKHYKKQFDEDHGDVKHQKRENDKVNYLKNESNEFKLNSAKTIEKELNKSIENYLLKKGIDEKVESQIYFSYGTKFPIIPSQINLFIGDSRLRLERENNKYIENKYFKNSIEPGLVNFINKEIINIGKNIIKNSKKENLYRSNERSKENNLQFEDYFPY